MVVSEAKTAINVLSEINKEYDSIIFVAGGDRTDDFEKLFRAYNNVPNKAGEISYNFEFIDVVSAGERDPEAEDVTGMSASKLRAFAQAGDFENFRKGVPTDDEGLAKQLFEDVRAYMEL